MLLIKVITISVLFTFWFIYQSRLAEKLKLNFKPFNCDICLPFWVSLVLYWLPLDIINVFFCALISAVFTPFIKNFFVNLYFKK